MIRNVLIYAPRPRSRRKGGCCWTSHPTAGHTRTSQAPYVWQRQATYASKCTCPPHYAPDSLGSHAARGISVPPAALLE
jgi:hypothetical protein